MSRATVSLEEPEIRHLIGARAFALSQRVNEAAPDGSFALRVDVLGVMIRRLAHLHKALQLAAQPQPQGAANAETPQVERAVARADR